MVQDRIDNNNKHTIKNSDTEITIIATEEAATIEEKEKVMHPEPVYLQHQQQQQSDDFLSAATRQPAIMNSMSNIGLEMHPRIIAKDASCSFIWIDDHYKDLSNVKEPLILKRHHQFSSRGFCNLFTIFFIISIILFLFIYPFITMFFK
jgi:hypothetical protein